MRARFTFIWLLTLLSGAGPLTAQDSMQAAQEPTQADDEAVEADEGAFVETVHVNVVNVDVYVTDKQGNPVPG